MDFLVQLAEGFIGMFEAGGKQFVGLFTGILPTLICLITAVNALIKFVGEERVFRIARFCTKNIILRYTIFPILAVFFLTNPMAYTFGKFLPENQKPAFYDSAVSFVHPITGLFPHANAAELFVYLGIAAGIEKLGLSLGPLALRYFLVGIIIILLRGIITERITAFMIKRERLKQENSARVESQTSV